MKRNSYEVRHKMCLNSERIHNNKKLFFKTKLCFYNVSSLLAIASKTTNRGHALIHHLLEPRDCDSLACLFQPALYSAFIIIREARSLPLRSVIIVREAILSEVQGRGDGFP